MADPRLYAERAMALELRGVGVERFGNAAVPIPYHRKRG